MPTVNALQVPPPTNWQDFEELCCDLWKELWKDPHARRHGRQGQPQCGVDVFGQPGRGPDWAGVQCKLKDHARGKLTRKEIEDEVAKAADFNPRLATSSSPRPPRGLALATPEESAVFGPHGVGDSLEASMFGPHGVGENLEAAMFGAQRAFEVFSYSMFGAQGVLEVSRYPMRGPQGRFEVCRHLMCGAVSPWADASLQLPRLASR